MYSTTLTIAKSSIDNPLLDAALEYAECGYAVLPLFGISNGRCECNDANCRHPGKHPRVTNGVHDATEDETVIRKWWRQWPNSNIGLAVPHWAVVLDIDPRNGGEYRALGDVPPTVVAATGGGGWHAWFQIPKDCPLRGSIDMPGVDVRKPGSYVVAPPSLHASGERYRWSQGTLESRKPMGLPAHLLAMLKQSEKAEKAPYPSQAPTHPGNATRWLETALERAQPGNRNTTGFDLCCQLRDDHIDETTAETIVLDYAAQVGELGDHPYTAEEAIASLRQAYNHEARQPAISRDYTPTMRDYVSSPDVESVTTHARLVSSGLDSSLSQKTNFTGVQGGVDDVLRKELERRQDWVRRIQEADAMPSDGTARQPGASQLRYRAQCAVLQEAWGYLFGLPLISKSELSTCLTLTAANGLGMNGEMVLDFMFTIADVPRDDKPVKAPRGHFMKSLRNSTRLD